MVSATQEGTAGKGPQSGLGVREASAEGWALPCSQTRPLGDDPMSLVWRLSFVLPVRWAPSGFQALDAEAMPGWAPPRGLLCEVRITVVARPLALMLS